MRKSKLLILMMGILTVFAFSGCSGNDAANNLGRMMDGGTGTGGYYNGSYGTDDGTGYSTGYYGTDTGSYFGDGSNFGNSSMSPTGGTANNGGIGAGSYSGGAYGGGYANYR